MKNKIVAGIFLSLTLAFTSAAGRNPIDLVVVMDTSTSMSASYKDVSQYIVGPMLTEFLKIGDTFHLISFSNSSRNEISRRIDSYADVKTIIGRLLLMYPLDPNSDFIDALDNVYQYVRELPESRKKTVILISDGEHSPPASSVNAGLSPEETGKRIEAGTAKLKGNGWNFYFIKVPFAEGHKPAKLGQSTDKSGAVDVSGAVSGMLASPLIELTKDDDAKKLGAAIGLVFAEFPADLGKQARNFTIPVKVKNSSEKDFYLETVSVLIDGIDRMDKKSFCTLKPHSSGVLDLIVKLPDSQKAEKAHLLVTPVLADNIRLMPDQAEISVQVRDDPVSRFLSFLAPYLVFIVGLLVAIILLLILLAFFKKSMSAPSRMVASQKLPSENKKAAIGLRPADDEDEKKKAAQKKAALASTTAAASRSSSADEAKKSQITPAFRPASAPAAAGNTGSKAHLGGTITTWVTAATQAFKPASAFTYTTKNSEARIMLSLWVQDQNRAIGKRNIHLMKPGTTLSVGGGRSDFWVFLVKIPANVANIHYDGETCTLVPLKPEYFPDTGESIIEDCVGKTVRIVSDKKYELFLKFEEYEDPLIKLNQFLRSIEMAD